MTEKTAETPTDYPGGHRSLAAALAAFQADLPSVHKGSTGQVGQNKNYKYADLSDLNGAVLPKLGAVGLSFSAKPTINEAGVFVLAYVLRHVSGDSDGGEWPLPDTTNSQQIGSSLTYARRYSLQAVTGVAPDEDDDGRAAGDATHRPANSRQRPAQPAQEVTPGEPDPTSPADRERTAIAELAASKGWTLAAVSAEYGRRYDGEDIRATQNANRLKAFAKLLPDAMAPATNGAAQ